MDIIVIKKEDGSLSSSPFHIRFGTLKILKTKEKIVDIYVNGKKTLLNMKLSSSGDAYFSQERIKTNLFNQNIIPIYDENLIIQKEKKTNSTDKKLNNQDDSPISLKKSAPNSPTKMSKTLDIFPDNDCILDEEKQEVNLIKVPSFQTRENDISPKFKREVILLNSCDSSIDVQNVKIGKIIEGIQNTKIQKDLIKSLEISISCNEILKSPEKANEIFRRHIVKKEEFIKDPWKILNNSNLLLSFDGKLYQYKAAVPLLMSLLIYGEELQESVLNGLTASKGVFSYFSSSENKLNKIKLTQLQQEEKIPKINKELPNVDPDKFIRKESKSKSRCFAPNDEQIKLLGLYEGRNEISFVCSSKLSGKQILKSDIYLWDYDSKIVISDIDGTITKSDVLGHLMPMIGKDWSQEGVTGLFTNIEKNGYKIMYLTARALCQSDTTKNFIQTLFQDQTGLPRGPIITSPDGLVSSFKREVIDKTPQTFKIACLSEIKNLFHKDYLPFYSGFGNRITDAVSYRSVGIDLSKIFIINEKGEVTQLNNSYKKTYLLLNEIVDDLFPPIPIAAIKN